MLKSRIIHVHAVDTGWTINFQHFFWCIIWPKKCNLNLEFDLHTSFQLKLLLINSTHEWSTHLRRSQTQSVDSQIHAPCFYVKRHYYYILVGKGDPARWLWCTSIVRSHTFDSHIRYLYIPVQYQVPWKNWFEPRSVRSWNKITRIILPLLPLSSVSLFEEEDKWFQPFLIRVNSSANFNNCLFRSWFSFRTVRLSFDLVTGQSKSHALSRYASLYIL